MPGLTDVRQALPRAITFAASLACLGVQAQQAAPTDELTEPVQVAARLTQLDKVEVTGRHYDNASAYALGYVPQDGSEGWDGEVLREDPPPARGSAAARAASEVSLGGQFSQSEYEGDTDRLLSRSRSAR